MRCYCSMGDAWGWGWPNCSWGLPTDGHSNKAVFRIIQYSRGHRTRKIPYALDCVWVGVMPMVPCAIGDEDQHSIQTGNPEEGSGRSFPTIVKGQRNREATLPAATYLNVASIHSYVNFNISISKFDYLFIFEFNNLFDENEDRFVLRRKLQGISGLYWLFQLSWEFWQQHIVLSSFL